MDDFYTMVFGKGTEVVSSHNSPSLIYLILIIIFVLIYIVIKTEYYLVIRYSVLLSTFDDLKEVNDLLIKAVKDKNTKFKDRVEFKVVQDNYEELQRLKKEHLILVKKEIEVLNNEVGEEEYNKIKEAIETLAYNVRVIKLKMLHEIENNNHLDKENDHKDQDEK